MGISMVSGPFGKCFLPSSRLSKNTGMSFTRNPTYNLNLFDRLFGTFKDLDESHKTHFGVLHPPNSYHPWTILTHEYKDIWRDVKQAKTWKERWMYTFGPPGWSPDGSRKTVREIQKEMEQLNYKSQEEMPSDIFAHEAKVVG